MNIKTKSDTSILQLTVKNHPGVMSHICGLFARRSYNVEGIMCLPLADGQLSRVWLMVDEDAKLEQVMQQTRKLVDVIDVQRRGVEPAIFPQLQALFGGCTEGAS